MQSQLPLIKLENFEGPFDLLIELARARKVDLAEVSLRDVTDAFLEYLRGVKLAPEVLGDFLIVAATLLLLKVRHLRPQLSKDEEEEVQNLEERVRAYQFFRERALWIRTTWRKQVLLSAGAFAPTRELKFSGELGMDAGTLGGIWGDVIKRMPKPIEKPAHLRQRGRSLRECLALLKERLEQLKSLVFQHVIRDVGRQEAAVTFLAVLELARQGQVQLSQESSGGDLVVERNG